MRSQLATVEMREKHVELIPTGSVKHVAAPINPLRTGLVFGALLGLFHFTWAICVAAGWAQPMMNFIFWLHFLTPPWSVQPFHAGIALGLVVVTSAIGFAIGYVAASLWNWLRE